jgi:hypothetical protein
MRPSTPPADRTSQSAARSTLTLAAVEKASAISVAMPIEIELLMSLQVVPAPSGP